MHEDRSAIQWRRAHRLRSFFDYSSSCPTYRCLPRKGRYFTHCYAFHATKVEAILVSYLTYDRAGYALPILSAVDYVVVAAGYLCLAQQTVRHSRSQRCLVQVTPYLGSPASWQLSQ
jgi:hypothetical protein